MRTQTLINFVKFIVLISLGALLFSCKTQKVRPQNEVTVALGAPPFSLDPLIATDATGMRLVSLTHQGLVRIGSNLKAESDLAKSWSISNENYTFYIDRSKRFSDGSPLLCEHLKQSVKAYQSEKTPFKRAFKPIVKTNCETNDSELVLTLKLKKPSAKFLLSDLPVLKIIGPNKIGSGPFVLTKKEPTLYIFSPNKFYSKKISYNLKFFFLKDDFSRFLKTYKGEIDIAPNSIPFEKLTSFKNVPRFQHLTSL